MEHQLTNLVMTNPYYKLCNLFMNIICLNSNLCDQQIYEMSVSSLCLVHELQHPIGSSSKSLVFSPHWSMLSVGSCELNALRFPLMLDSKDLRQTDDL